MNTLKKVMIDENLVIRLISTQFPQWKNLPIKPVKVSGWDNKTFHLGDSMLIRMPSAAEYESQVEKEHQWLPKLAPFLSLPIPVPLAMGKPVKDYPWKWSIYRWLDGQTATLAHIENLGSFAKSLAIFLKALHNIDTTGGPMPGTHSFYRGASLTTYDAQTRDAINILKDKINVDAVTRIWEEAIITKWQNLPVWVHGDVSSGNLLVKDGQLSAVIDFGQLTVGDPACDLAIAWNFFDNKSREIFRETLKLDNETWARGRAWALWKALIIAAGITGNSAGAIQSLRSIETIIHTFTKD